MIYSDASSVIRGRKTLGTMRFPNEAEACEMCCAFTDAICKLYPGYEWRALINQDLLWIQNTTLDNENAFAVHLADIDVEGRALARIAGEILERYGARRGKASETELKELKYDFLDNAKQI